MRKINLWKFLHFGLLGVVFLFVVLAANFITVYPFDYDDNIGYFEEINMGKLSEINEKYQHGISSASIDEAPCDSAQNGTLDYIDYQNRNYYATTTFNRTTYFQNLTDYSPKNNIGSCGYVSLIQLLSFYDTFYNDSIIPEQYDRKNTTATSETEAKHQSPGVLRQYYSGSGYSSYYEYCNATMDSDLQSRLTVIMNTKYDTNNKEKFNYSIGAWSYQDVLDGLYGNSSTVKVNWYDGLSQTEYLQLINESIGSGNPVIVHINKYDETEEVKRHSVVAYSYDESGIYANFGWGSYANKYQLLGGSAGYSEIYCVATLDFSNLGHSHSDNYIINSTTYCGCNISDKLNFNVSTSWKNIPPTFYWMKNVYDSDETYQITFKKSMNGANIVSYTVSTNQMTLSVQTWANILNQSNGTVYIEFKRHSDIVNYNPVIYSFNETNKSMQHISLSPAEYGFDGRYYYESEGIRYKDIIKDDYTISTSRLRCGYIENEYIVLSAKRENNGVAYLDYAFDVGVYRIDVDLTLWSNNEFISQYNAEAYIQYKNSFGQWITVLDLLKDIALSEDRTTPINYTIVFPEAISEFRFYETSKYGNDRNKGRICIGNMDIYLEA